MDTQYDEKMYHQMDQKLLNTIDDSLFTMGKGYEVEQPIPSNEEPCLSRAEYIRQAREACMRQLNTIHMDQRSMEPLLRENNEEEAEAIPEIKKTKVKSFFRENTTEDSTSQELKDFRFMIIRIVCAITLFLSVFLADQFKFNVGSFTHEVIRECITGNDQLVKLENMVVSLLK